MQRLLADPYSTGDEPPPWHAPAVPPETTWLRAAAHELERALLPAPTTHMRWLLSKLFVLPTKADTTEGTAFLAENFLDVCGHLPADLWTSGTRDLLRTKIFRPVPSELLAIAEPQLRQRRRMLDRARGMITQRPPQQTPAKLAYQMAPNELHAERIKRLREGIPILRKHGRAELADSWARELAALENG